MEVFIEKINLSKKIKFSGTAADLLKKLNLNQEESLIVRENELLTLDEKIRDSDKIRILSVVSGG